MTKDITDWNNEDQSEYYEKAPMEDLLSFSKIAGLDSCKDLDLIRDYINESKNILEVGAAYGRVVENILDHGYLNSLTAIERSNRFYNHLVNKFNKKATIIHGDIRDYLFESKFDLILLMWSNISEHPKQDQENLLKQLRTILSDSGILVIETIDHTLRPKNAMEFLNQTYMFHSEYGTIHGYVPSPKEIDHYVKKTGFKLIRSFSYMTTTSRKRMMYIMEPNIEGS